MSTYFDDTELDRLMEAAERLMPDEGRLPSVAEAGLRERFIDDAVTARPETLEIVKVFAAAAQEHGVEAALEHARTQQPEVWDAVTSILPGAYFLSPLVRERLGYRGQGPDPIQIETRPDYEEFLGAVVARGPVYRPTPA